jgi:branched-chain amino acid transport system substrate-binding protein
MRKKANFIMICVFGVALLLAPNVSLADMPSSVKIAIAQPLTGFLALNGKEVMEGAQLAEELVNKNGGIKGKTKIVLVEGDTRCNPTNAVNATQRLLNQDIDFYVGNYCSSASLATMPILEAEGIPQIILSYAPSITAEARTPNSVRIGPSAPLEMSPLAKYAIQVIGDKTFAAIGLNNDFGRAMTEEFAKTAEKFGGKVLDFQYFKFGADFSTYLTKVKNLKPDAVMVIAMGNDTISFTKSYYELGLKMNIYTGDNFADTQYVNKQTPKPQNLYYPYIYQDDSAKAAGVPDRDSWSLKFVDEFKKKFGKEPTRNNAWGYACIMVFQQAVASTGTTDKKKISEYLHSGAEFETPFGKFGFQWCGQSVNKAGIGKFKGDAKYYLKSMDWGDDVLGDLCPAK